MLLFSRSSRTTKAVESALTVADTVFNIFDEAMQFGENLIYMTVNVSKCKFEFAATWRKDKKRLCGAKARSIEQNSR